MYKYEIQIDQQANNGVKGVTYSYKSTVFYGKAELQGIFTAQSKSLILRETKLVDLKVAGQSEPCLMTCYLDYSKIGKLEFLQGTFISINAKDKGDCGSGKVYLEKVTNSDFKKEDFLLKKKEIDTAREKAGAADKNNAKPITPPPGTGTTKPTTNPPPAKSNTASAPKNSDKTAGATVSKPSVTAPQLGNNASKQPQKPVPPAPNNRIPEESVIRGNRTDSAITARAGSDAHTRKILIPKVLVERENNLVTTILTDQEDLQIDLYDNGTIDHDSISVYHNNVLVVNNNELTYSPITIRLKCTKTDAHHEIIVVAENLGEIPPNTALMVITAGGKSIIDGGKKRIEVFLDSNEQRNAKVVFEYKPKQ